MREEFAVKLEFDLSQSDLDLLLPCLRRWAVPRLWKEAILLALIVFVALVLLGSYRQWTAWRFGTVAIVYWSAILVGYWCLFRSRRLGKLLGGPGKRSLFVRQDGSIFYTYEDGTKEYSFLPEEEVDAVEYQGHILLLYGESASRGQRIVAIPKQVIHDGGHAEKFRALLKKRNRERIIMESP